MGEPRIIDTADLDDGVTIGDGSSIWHLSQVRSEAVLGRNVVVGRGAYIGEGVRVGDNLQNRTAALSQRRDDSVLAGIPHEDVVQADRQGTSCQPATHRIRPDPAARDEGSPGCHPGEDVAVTGRTHVSRGNLDGIGSGTPCGPDLSGRQGVRGGWDASLTQGVEQIGSGGHREGEGNLVINQALDVVDGHDAMNTNDGTTTVDLEHGTTAVCVGDGEGEDADLLLNHGLDRGHEIRCRNVGQNSDDLGRQHLAREHQPTIAGGIDGTRLVSLCAHGSHHAACGRRPGTHRPTGRLEPRCTDRFSSTVE